jgi:hypothetical protein|nr:MAG TPA: hypothetical protein [Caudoviricetes sp.]
METTIFVIEKINSVLEDGGSFFDEKLGKMQHRTIYKRLPSTFFNVEISDEEIIVNGHKMKLVYDHEFVYKLQKTQIKTMGREQLERFLKADYASCLVEDVCEHVVKYGKSIS